LIAGIAELKVTLPLTEEKLYTKRSITSASAGLTMVQVVHLNRGL